MMVSPKYKIVLVCIPKTGSSSLCTMLQRADPSWYIHKSRHAVMNQSDADLFKDHLKIAVVRNSYKLCASFYRFMTEKIKDERQEPPGLISLIKSQLVATETSLDWQIRESKNPFPLQLDYFSEEGKILVDNILFYDKGLDSEASDLKKQLDHRGILAKNEDVHYYGEYDWRYYYSGESVDYVTQLCQKDIEYFGFKFE